jgi:HK97 family phage major capsid protein
MADLLELKTAIDDSNASIEAWKARESARISEIEKRLNRPNANIGGSDTHESATARKALDTAFRALIAGDQAKADRALDEYRVEQKAMQVGVDPSGGYLVSPTISSEMTRVMLETAPFLTLARTVNMRTGASFEEVVDRNAAAAAWVSELQSRSDTDSPDVEKLIIELNELFAMPKVSQKLIDTADVDVVAWLSQKIAEAFANVESDAFFSGNGVGKPRGFLTMPTASTADATRAWGTLQHIPTGASGAFHTTKADPLIDAVYALKAQYRTGSVWMMNRKTAAVVRKLKEATSDQYLWSPGLISGQPDQMLGYPVLLAEEMPDVAANSLSIAFGNFQAGYTIIRQPGIRMLTDPYTDKPNVRLAAYERVGGGVTNSEAIKVIKFSAT